MASTAADVLIDTIHDWGVEVIFGLPGDGINGIMEALRQRQDKVRFVQVRHEEAAAFMACGYAIRGRPHLGRTSGSASASRTADMACPASTSFHTPAAVRFLSVEPLLEDLGQIDLTGIHWVIGGGESGPGARPMDLDWVRSIRDQCTARGGRSSSSRSAESVRR
jgi:hypothetical protein